MSGSLNDNPLQPGERTAVVAESVGVSIIKQLQQDIETYKALQSLHLEALRRISSALGHPFKGDRTKNVLDLAELAVERIKRADCDNCIALREFNDSQEPLLVTSLPIHEALQPAASAESAE